MIKVKLYKVVFFITLFIFPVFFASASNCVVGEPLFDPRGDNGTAVISDRTFFSSSTASSPAIISFTVPVAGCAGDTIGFRLRNNNNDIPLTDIISVNVPSDSGGSGDIKVEIPVGTSMCDDAADPHCQLSLVAFVNGDEQYDTYGSFAANVGNRVGYYCGDLGVSCFETLPLGAMFGVPRVPPVSWSTQPSVPPVQALFGSSRLINPLTADNIPELVRRIVNFIFVIGVPIVAIAIIYAGFLIVTSAGNVEKAKSGRQALVAALIGGAILLGAWVIGEALQDAVNEIRNS